MSHKVVTCEHCGALCNQDDGYCKSCWKKLASDSGQDYVLEGHGHSLWADFIEKNKERYIRVFEKNEGKTIFVSWNWAAFFFGLNWMFYRKMYKMALICYLILLVLNVATMGIAAVPYIPDIQQAQERIESCEEQLESGNRVWYDDEGNVYDLEMSKRDAEWKIADIQLEILLWSTLLSLIVQPIFVGLFGDAFYKAHVKKNILTKKGGASLSSWLAGTVLFDLLEGLVFSPLMSFLIILLVR